MGTLLGALAGQALSDPKVLGLDAAIPAAFLALVAPRMRSREPWIIALAAAVVALVSFPFVPLGVPVLLAAMVAAGLGLGLRPAYDTPEMPAGEPE